MSEITLSLKTDRGVEQVVHKLFSVFTGVLSSKQDDNYKSEKLDPNDEEDVMVQQPDVSIVSPEIISHI